MTLKQNQKPDGADKGKPGWARFQEVLAELKSETEQPDGGYLAAALNLVNMAAKQHFIKELADVQIVTTMSVLTKSSDNKLHEVKELKVTFP